jgi:hypothetical protein
LSALLLAPLVIPVPAGVLFVSGSVHPVAAFGLGAVVGYLFALMMVGWLLLPTLWLVSWVAPIKAWLPPVIGGLWAALIFLAWDRINWGASGVDSGPPATTYREWIAKSWFTPEPLYVIAFGAVTAAVYRFLATRKPNETPQPIPQSRNG